jgi:galactokinase/mevalonate kinase-like predicted kinase
MRIDEGTCPPSIKQIIDRAQPHIAGCTLLGAGGGGFFLFLARDRQAAVELQRDLEASPPNSSAQFYEWSVSKNGTQVIRDPKNVKKLEALFGENV